MRPSIRAMNTGNSRRAVWAGTFTALVLVIAFGNQWLWEEILKKRHVGDNSGWHILNWLSTPHWVIDKSGVFQDLEGKYVAAFLVGVLALLVTVAVTIGAAAARPGFSPFVTGWFALVAGGGAYGIVSYLIGGGNTTVTLIGAANDERSLGGALAAIGGGGGYGLLAGWAVGLVTALAAASAGPASQGYFTYTPAPPPPVNPPHGGGYRY